VRPSRPVLVLAFAFTVMADPVSSVAYAIEATLRSLDGDLASLLPTMAVIIAIIGVISATYHELIGRFPGGGGGPEGIAKAFGEGWAFIPLGALLVDFTLTVAVSCAAGASAVIAYVPELESVRTPIGLGLVVLVAGGVLLGRGGRVAFALATLSFIGGQYRRGGPGRDNPRHQRDPPRRLDRTAHLRRCRGLFVAHLGFTRPTPGRGHRWRPVIGRSRR